MVQLSRIALQARRNAALNSIVHDAVELMVSDLGNVQLFNAGGDTLEIAAQRGFDEDFMETFRIVNASSGSACGRALRDRTQIIIEDVDAEETYESYRDAAHAAGYRAVVSTPMISKSGELVGVISVHYRLPCRPPENLLAALQRYAGRAANVLKPTVLKPGAPRSP